MCRWFWLQNKKHIYHVESNIARLLRSTIILTQLLLVMVAMPIITDKLAGNDNSRSLFAVGSVFITYHFTRNPLMFFFNL